MTLIRADLAHPSGLRARPGDPGLIKLASNEVPLPPSGPGPRRDRRGRRAAQPLPRPGRHRPDRAGSPTRWAWPPERIAVGCGSVSLCQQLVQATCLRAGDEVLFAWRSFEAYPIVTQIGGGHGRHGAAGRRSSGTTSTRWPPRHPAHPAGVGVQPEQPDRHRGHPGRDGALPRRRRARRRWWPSTRRTTSTSPTRTPSTAWRCSTRTPTWWSCARSPRPTGWPGCGSATRSAAPRWRRRCARCARRSASARSPRPARSPRSTTRTNLLAACAEMIEERVRVRDALLDGRLHRAADPVQLRVAGAGRADGRVRRALPGPQGRGAPVPARRRAGHGLDAGGERHVAGRGRRLPRT